MNNNLTATSILQFHFSNKRIFLPKKSIFILIFTNQYHN